MDNDSDKNNSYFGNWEVDNAVIRENNNGTVITIYLASPDIKDMNWLLKMFNSSVSTYKDLLSYPPIRLYIAVVECSNNESLSKSKSTVFEIIKLISLKPKELRHVANASVYTIKWLINHFNILYDEVFPGLAPQSFIDTRRKYLFSKEKETGRLTIELNQIKSNQIK